MSNYALGSRCFFFFFNDTATTEIYTLSLHDALPICISGFGASPESPAARSPSNTPRSEEHTSELQSHHDLVCRLLLEKKKKTTQPSQPAQAKCIRQLYHHCDHYN